MKKQSDTPCVQCGGRPTDWCHIKSKGSGGSDGPENRIFMCRKHHREQHAYGWDKFLERYPKIRFTLDGMGFEIQEVFGVKKLVKR